ncbi:hypothetical protein M3182_00605 [Mesobacillus maritimus]|uniref:phage lytic cycle repressor MrpR family protein n=1 Tax=Mesobacillus maritimus TaxID=1643336 RepID=UPI00203DC521|nr:hypothetical protein [Mesobacillus maritimus]MCM3584239.1 hypothetical protein [Mesobacillus maritimus]
MNILYNEEIKNIFLSIYDNPRTQNTIKYVFYKSASIERYLDKDLYNFSLTQIGEVIEKSRPYSSTVARSSGRNISQYISWAIENGYSDISLNPLKDVDSKWCDQFVDKNKRTHFSEDELYNIIIEHLPNAQDQALISVLFEGIIGEDFKELKNLSYNNINWETNEIIIIGRNTPIMVSDRTIWYLKKATNETTYYFYNTESDDYTKKELIDSKFIFKNVMSPRAKKGQPVSKQTFYSKLNSIKEILDVDFNPNSIKQSGMIKMAADIVKKKVEIGDMPELAYNEFALIGEKYNVSKLSNNGYEYYNTNLIREFITEDKLNELYGLIVSISKR